MAQSITGFGSTIRIIASKTFPNGFDVTEFADDADAFDTSSIQIGDSAMTVNGTLATWVKAMKIPFTLSVLSGSNEDDNLDIIVNANRAIQGNSGANDNITLTVTYTDGSTATFLNGIITDAPIAKSLASSGRLKTRTYGFAFEDKVGS